MRTDQVWQPNKKCQLQWMFDVMKTNSAKTQTSSKQLIQSQVAVGILLSIYLEYFYWEYRTKFAVQTFAVKILQTHLVHSKNIDTKRPENVKQIHIFAKLSIEYIEYLIHPLNIWSISSIWVDYLKYLAYIKAFIHYTWHIEAQFPQFNIC